MKLEQGLQNFITKHSEELSKAKGLFEFLSTLREKIEWEEQRVSSLNEVFQKFPDGIMNFHICEECGSPVLLEYGKCPFCCSELSQPKTETAVEAEEVVGEVEPVKEEVVEEVEEPVKEEVVEEVKPKKKKEKKAKKAKKVEKVVEPVKEVKPKKKKVVEVVVEDEEEEEFEEEVEIPNEEAINAMNMRELKALVKEFGLEIVIPKSVKQLRKLVNDEFDEMVRQDSEEGEYEIDELYKEDGAEVEDDDEEVEDDALDDEEIDEEEEEDEEEEDFNLDELTDDELDEDDDEDDVFDEDDE